MLEKEISKAKEILKSSNSTKKDKESANDNLRKAVRKCKLEQNYKEATVKVVVNRNINGQAETFKLKVSGDIAEKFGQKKDDINYRKVVTMLDVAYAIHYQLYGEDFKTNPKGWFEYKYGTVSRMFGSNKGLFFFCAKENKGIEAIAKSEVKDGMTVNFAIYPQNDVNTQFLHIKEKEIEGEIGNEIKLTLLGGSALMASYGQSEAKVGYTILFENVKTKEIVESLAPFNENGELYVKFDKEGKYVVKAVKHNTQKNNIVPELNLDIKPQVTPVEPMPSEAENVIVQLENENINKANKTKMIEGLLTYTRGISEGLEIRIPNYNPEDLDSVFIDDKLVQRGNYSLRKGSIILALKKDFVDKLSVGKHKIKVYLKNKEEGEGEFRIAENNQEEVNSNLQSDNSNSAVIDSKLGENKKAETNRSAKTGDEKDIIVYVIALMISLLGTILLRRKARC